jgi:hypothetical protein
LHGASSSKIGFDLSGGISGAYGDNTTSSVTTGYNTGGTGMANIGNNN